VEYHHWGILLNSGPSRLCLQNDFNLALCPLSSYGYIRFR